MKYNIHPNLLPLMMPIDECHLDPANARTGHNIERIAGSLRQYGQRKPIVVNKNEANKIEAGNGTWQAAKLEGWTHIAAVVVEDDASTAVGFALADNRTAELSRWDYEALQALVESLDPALELVTGFEGDELEELLRAAGIEPTGATDLGEPGDAEPPRWFYRFDTFYRSLGPERSLLAAYRYWHQAERGRKSEAASAPTSWREAAERWQWAERAEAWDFAQRLERLKEEDEARQKNRERRIALLNAVMARASDALLKLQADEAKWADVMTAIRLAVQELRHEYGDDVTTVKVETTEMIPEWMTAVARMDNEQLERVIQNMEMARPAE